MAPEEPDEREDAASPDPCPGSSGFLEEAPRMRELVRIIVDGDDRQQGRINGWQEASTELENIVRSDGEHIK